MKFMTWNVNGIRALTQYHPYCDDLHKNYREILDYLDADVICLQETKITRSKLETDLALVPGYDSYWSFHRTKSGYSGVVVYVKEHIKLLAAEEGISGVLSGNIILPSDGTLRHSDIRGSNGGNIIPSLSRKSTFDSNDPNRKRVGGYPSLETDGAAALSRFQELDTEGRGIVLDFGFFVLFNLYCPNETDDTRLPFKMDYYHLLEARVQELIKEGREVMVLGDMNVIPTELDHCDPEKWKKETGESDFTNTMPRRWFNSFLAPNGPLTDLYRVFHKDEPGAFTCWNTKINARPSNYGTRLDYILVTSGLLPWFKSCDRKPKVVGSDHCPVVAEMYTELTLEKSQEELETEESFRKSQQLQDILDSYGGTTDHALAAKFFDEFAGKQQKLSAFFKKPGQPTSSSPSGGQPPTPGDTKRPVAFDSPSDQAPRKKLFFSTGDSKETTSSWISPTPPSIANTTTPSAPGTNVIPRSTNKMVTKAGTSRPSYDKGALKKASNSKIPKQQSVLSFFSSPSKNASSSMDLTAVSPSSSQSTDQDTASSSQQSTTSSSWPSQQQDASQPSSSSATSSLSSTFTPNDFADWIPGADEVLPFSLNEESTTSKWQSLFQPKAVPKCRFHGAPYLWVLKAMQSDKNQSSDSLRLAPSSKPSAAGSASVLNTSNSYGLHDAMRFGMRQIASEVSAKHPLENRLAEWESTQEELKMNMARNAYGMHAPIKMAMERSLVIKAHGPSMLPKRSNLGLDILMGRDETIDFEDFLNVPELSTDMVDPHVVMEHQLGIRV
ncbi:Class II abasic (AP) endonuclease [Dissophora globulifera]|uniref:DNA-(apurinic or apyrimidinic site) endonuclease n=1 Tax=Dissophora globulifera TaxID=979702 RepID=A0A9P6RIA8_9FUNG|nr:Class II abasic (AP) endonuclease [Dissophora globulifera]